MTKRYYAPFPVDTKRRLTTVAMCVVRCSPLASSVSASHSSRRTAGVFLVVLGQLRYHCLGRRQKGRHARGVDERDTNNLQTAAHKVKVTAKKSCTAAHLCSLCDGHTICLSKKQVLLK